MCTGIKLSDNNNVLFARTMDFSFELDPIMGVVPRNYPFPFIYEGVVSEHRSFQGLTKDLGAYFFADGVNEHGMIAATLYFEGYAKYELTKKEGDFINLAPFEVVAWVLAHYDSIDALEKDLDKIVIVDTMIEFLQVTPPLHFVFTDISGRSVVVEPTDAGLVLYENEVGVLTNAPDYPWHITNLRNYIGLNPNQREPLTLDDNVFKAFGQGSGTFGLPGDYTPPARFVRAFYGKTTIKDADGEEKQVIAASHILSSVDIPKGAVITPRHTMDYTQYTSFMSATSSKYYFKLYNSTSITEVDLSDFDLDSEVFYRIEIPHEIVFNKL